MQAVFLCSLSPCLTTAAADARYCLEPQQRAPPHHHLLTEPGKGPIVAAIHLDRTAERGLVVNQIQSLYGRPPGDIAMMFGESPIYENKTKCLSMARLFGLQLPKR
ncbi:hypothetical protein, partial [Verrucomicrobium spinosum]|uniref:hypothetical protein n=1 Tax=Verrucomicrobium spinosum TaxID=2736 RepID=UPI001C4935F3